MYKLYIPTKKKFHFFCQKEEFTVCSYGKKKTKTTKQNKAKNYTAPLFFLLAQHLIHITNDVFKLFASNLIDHQFSCYSLAELCWFVFIHQAREDGYVSYKCSH